MEIFKMRIAQNLHITDLKHGHTTTHGCNEGSENVIKRLSNYSRRDDRICTVTDTLCYHLQVKFREVSA